MWLRGGDPACLAVPPVGDGEHVSRAGAAGALAEIRQEAPGEGVRGACARTGRLPLLTNDGRSEQTVYLDLDELLRDVTAALS